MRVFLATIFALFIAIIVWILMFWGIGNFVILVFDINYKWTILHAIACYLVTLLLVTIGKSIFSK